MYTSLGFLRYHSLSYLCHESLLHPLIAIQQFIVYFLLDVSFFFTSTDPLARPTFLNVSVITQPDYLPFLQCPMVLCLFSFFLPANQFAFHNHTHLRNVPQDGMHHKVSFPPFFLDMIFTCVLVAFFFSLNCSSSLALLGRHLSL